MPFGYGDAVFTTSAGGDIGGGRRQTRLIGPILVGQKIDNGVAAGIQSGATPLYALPPHIVNVSTSPADWQMTAGPYLSTAGITGGLLFISQTSAQIFTSSGGGTDPVPASGSFRGGAAIVYDFARKKLCVFSTEHGWVGTAPMTSS